MSRVVEEFSLTRVGRSRLEIDLLMEATPKPLRDEMTIAFERLWDAAMKEIREAYWDGYRSARLKDQAREFAKLYQPEEPA